MRRRDEAGETLVEILISVVIMGLVTGAIFATYATAASGSKSQRTFVAADAALRDAAELTKSAVKTQCGNGGTSYTVDFSALATNGITPPASITNNLCPGPTTVTPVTFTVTWPGQTQSLTIDVRSP